MSLNTYLTTEMSIRPYAKLNMSSTQNKPKN